MEEEFKKEIISRIRSCLISTKGRVSLRQLEDDYRTLLGERIPYVKLGHKNLESFISTIPSIITSRGPNGEMFVDAQVSEKSAHISSMVRKQKSSGVKKRVRVAPKFNRAMAQPPPTTNKWRPTKNPVMDYNRVAYQRSPRLSAISHNQFISGGSYNKPKVPSKVVVVENKSHNKDDGEFKRPNFSLEKIQERNGDGENVDESSPSSFTSTMKRISKIMSEISVERDSGNSSPTAEYAATCKLSPGQEFIKTGDPVTDLKAFASYQKLGEVEIKFSEQMMESKIKKSKVVQWLCKITVGHHKYSSYPEEFFDKASAEQYASQKALDNLMQKYSRRRSLLLSSNDDIMARIPPMLEKHHNAVWMWQIEAEYIHKYNEQLPPDWLQVIDNSLYVSIEKCPRGYVLKHCDPTDKGKKLDVSLNIGDVSVPCNTLNVGDDNRLTVYISIAHSVNEVWCQHVGTPEYDKFCEMMHNMDVYYNSHKSEMLARNINVGSCYAIKHEAHWSRVRAVTMPQDGFTNCFLLDCGDEVHVAVQDVCILKREFALDQAQAFVCRLTGLEDLYEVSVESEHLQALTGKQAYMEVVCEERSDGDVTLPVLLYDTLTGASINEELISLLAMDAATPMLESGTINEVYVSNIEPNGDIYVQVRNYGYYTLEEMLENLSETITKEPPLDILTPLPNKDNSVDRVYLVKCKITQKWLRATIIDWSPKGDMAQIYFLDHGCAQVINVTNEQMFPLDKLDEVVNEYPAQAIKVRMMIDKIPEDFVRKAQKLLPQDQPVLLKIVDHDNEQVSWVDFFIRTSDGVLVHINKSISVEAELQNIDISNNNEVNTRKRLMNLVHFGDGSKTVPSGGYLPKPNLPKIGGYFNVNVPFAVNPWNFFVQPLDSFAQLTALMADMQENYKDVHFSPLQVEDVIPGKIYASKHEDGLWYRTSVLKVIHSGSISVFYCDFGYYTNLTLAQLIPLDPKYMSFPYQALKAKLSGIKPVKNKWTMDDCDVFNSLVTKKQFVSVLINVEKDELYKSDIILQLLLIDTSSEDDVNVTNLLIEKGIATGV